MLAERCNGLLAVVFCCSILAACSSDSPSGCSAQSSVFRVSPGGFAECRPGLTPAEDGQRSIAAAAVSPLPSRAGGVARVALPAILNHCPAPSPGKFASWLAAADGLLLEYGPWSASGVLGKVPAKFMHEREAAVPGSTIVRGTGDDWQQSHAAAGCGGRKHRYVSHMVARPSEDLWRVSTAGALATRSICKCFWMNAFLRLESVALDAVWRFGGAWVAPFVTGLPGIEYHGHVAAGVTVHILAARSAILFTLGIFCTAVRYGSELLEIGGIDGPVRQLAWGCIAAVAIVTFRVAQAPAQLRSASIFATVAGWAVSVLRDSGFSADNWMVNSMLTALFFTYLWVQAVGTCPELGNGRLGGVVPIMVAAAAYNNRNVRGGPQRYHRLSRLDLSWCLGHASDYCHSCQGPLRCLHASAGTRIMYSIHVGSVGTLKLKLKGLSVLVAQQLQMAIVRTS